MAVGPQARARALARRATVALEYERIAQSRRAPIDENTVVYESFSGNGMLCNPEAIFRALLAADDMQHLRHVWALANLTDYTDTIAEFVDNPRVSFVELKSNDYYKALASAKYLINNATFPSQFGKRTGQIYVNTWHGTPLKAMGYDVPGGAVDTRNIVRNFLSADYLLAPNEDTARMYLDAYRMQNIFRGKIVAEGTPRIDKQFTDESGVDRTRATLRRHGVVLGDDHQVLLYAPTWKGSFYAPTNDIRQLRARVEAIRSQIDTDKYRVLLKVHQQVYKHAQVDPDLRELLVPNAVPTNDVLAVTDALITDYSSIFIDFLATGRPVLFYMPDIADYKANRGLNLGTDEWPGPVCRDLEQLLTNIKHLGSGGAGDPAVAYADAYVAARERYCAREDGQAAARVVDLVFRNNTAPYDVRTDFADGRTSILMHLGGMLGNGITSSALSLLDNIDHDRFDVSVTFAHTTSPARLRLIGLINSRVRLLPRLGGVNGSKLKVTPLLALKRRTERQHQAVTTRYADLLRDEWTRCFGEAQFDHVVDFSGYSPFWVKLLANRPSGSFSIWLHNDMLAEMNNSGRSDWLRNSVRGVTALYNRADRLVSVSEALNEVNRVNFAASAPDELFTYARNTINYQRIRHLAYGSSASAARTARTAPSGQAQSLQESIDELIAMFSTATVVSEIERRATLHEILPNGSGVRTFVTAGRLSTEKNHARLIRAFDVVHQEEPSARLVILGHGPLLERLSGLIEELGLASAVTLAGHQPNPYVVLANSDCFVLSSDYEGQPMVLLEALILGLPVISTAFDSVRGALPEGSGLVVAKDTKALTAGMRAFLRGEVPAKPFDYVQYNRDATDEFYRAIGAG
ncbi:MAG: CDP-glycerol glycerophosphotransferase family protein [Jatrophihabitans sp.]|uniref:CDP-glycerol glycerophosphotransferase family protein n=1 Tax=Jatrophihabitans sp. TaxID=1932789 RepID=UPI0039100A99